nr:hypothetical protein [Candidatus Sigynarchaeum springense]
MTKRFSKANVLLAIAGAMVAAWIMMLAVLAAMPTAGPTFTDVMTGADVSAQYSIERSPWRYILDPVSAFTFTGGADPLGIIVLVLSLYLVARVGFLLVEKVVEKVGETL